MTIVTLKSACDACTASRVKCSGEEPCARCAKKGLTCFYSPKKARAGAKRERRLAAGGDFMVANIPTKSAVAGDLADMGSSFAAHERRAWSVFFTLYKHYAVGCSVYWFNQQLLKMCAYLKAAGKTDALKRLTSWMGALGIDQGEFERKLKARETKLRDLGKAALGEKEAPQEILFTQEAAKILNNGSAPFKLQVKGSMESMSMPASSNQVDDPISLQDQTAMIAASGFRSERSHLDSDVASIAFEINFSDPFTDMGIECNPSFEALFGYGRDEIAKNFASSGGSGFLPWGADVLARMVAEESELLAFVQIIAIKFNALGRPKTWPVCRRVPSVHMLKILHKDSGRFGPVEAMVKAVHTEVVRNESSLIRVFMSFTPVEALPSVDSNVGYVATDKPLIPDGSVELPPKRIKHEHAVSVSQAPGQGSSFPQTIYDHASFQQSIKTIGTATAPSSTQFHPAPDAAAESFAIGAPHPGTTSDGSNSAHEAIHSTSLGCNSVNAAAWASTNYSPNDNDLEEMPSVDLRDAIDADIDADLWGSVDLSGGTAHNSKIGSPNSDVISDISDEWLADLLEWTGEPKPSLEIQ